MTAPGSGLESMAVQGIVGAIFLLMLALFVFGLAYRLWRWLTTPDEQTRRKREVRRQQLKRSVRRPAREVPIHEALQRTAAAPDPALNEEMGV